MNCHKKKFGSIGKPFTNCGWLVVSLLAMSMSCGLQESPKKEDSLIKSMASAGQRVTADYRGKAQCTGEPSLNVRAEPSIQASKISPALNFGEDVTVEDMQWDEVSHQYYANIGRGWVDIRWLKKVAAVPGGGVPCSTQYDDAFAVAAMGSPTRALLSIIGYAEGTGNCYNVMFGYKTFTSYAQHPNECRPFGNTCSTAAGRYQFLGRTWNEIKRVEGYQTFEPSNQDSGAIYLLQRRGVDNYEQQLSYTELVENLKLMSWEWASFPPGRYGQGFKSFEQMWSKYSQYSNE